MRPAFFLWAALLLAFIYFFYTYTSLSAEVAELSSTVEGLNRSLHAKEAELAELSASLSACRESASSLEREKGQLEEKLEECEARASLLEAMLNESEEKRREKEQELLNLLREVEEVREALYSDIEWFKENAYADEHLSVLERYCYDEGELNVACLSLYIQQEWGVSYKEESEDKLKGIEETLAEGGDCEDFTLLVNAYIRSLEPEVLLLWREGSGRFPLYEKGGVEYYLEEAEPVEVPYEGVVGVCYLTEREELTLYGHCVSAVADGFASLKGAVLFEPQSGQYLGRVGEDLHLCQEGDVECSEEVGNIFLVFTKDDFYIFSSGQWKSLKGLYERLGEYG